MTPTTSATSSFWGTLVAALLNTALAAVLNHYLGLAAAAGGVAAGTAAAHLAQSPLRK